jgi:quinol monooxygenase YgiN
MKFLTKAKSLLLATIIGFSFFGASASFAESYFVAELDIIPERLEEFQDYIKIVAEETRAYEGCLHFSVHMDDSDPTHILFYSIWEAKENHLAYRDWRNSTDFAQIFGSYLVGGVDARYYEDLPE